MFRIPQITPMKSTWIFLSVFVLLLVASFKAEAVNVVFSVEPEEDGKIVYAPIAPATDSHAPGAQLSLKLRIESQEPVLSRHLKRVEVLFAGPPAVAPVVFEQDLWIDPMSVAVLHLQRHPDALPDKKYNIMLPYPTPVGVMIELRFDSEDDYVAEYWELAPYANDTPSGSYHFPAKASDLEPGEYWSGASTGIASHHGGDQRFAYDMGVARWDETEAKWTGLHEGTSGTNNEDFLCWGKPLYAVADGIVEAFIGDRVDIDPGDEGIDGGNYVKIRVGDELFDYFHLMQGSVPALTVGAAISKGDPIGRVGNSGKSSGPHLHVHVTKPDPGLELGKDGHLRPLLFHCSMTVDRNTLDPADPLAGPWVPLQGRALPWSTVGDPTLDAKPIILPGQDGMYSEVARHGVKASHFQNVFDNIVGCGYMLYWIDGYEVDGENYFNALFRPADVKWTAKYGLNAVDYDNEFNQLVADGYHPHQVESYTDDGNIRYAFIFRHEVGPPAIAYHGKTALEHQTLFDNYTDDGYHPENISVVSIGGVRSYTALYELYNVGSWSARSFMTPDQYQTITEINEEAKRYLAYLNAYDHNGSERFTAIWFSNIDHPGVASHGMNLNRYQAEWEAQTGSGNRTQLVTGYGFNGDQYFAALWRHGVAPAPIHPSSVQADAIMSEPFTVKPIDLPRVTQVKSNFPNPFNPETWIPYQLSRSTDVHIQIYDVTGRLVRQLNLGHQQAGHYLDKSSAAYWDGRNQYGEIVPGGVYFYTFEAGNYRHTRKFVVLK